LSTEEVNILGLLFVIIKCMADEDHS